jgi:hypothetical protein
MSDENEKDAKILAEDTLDDALKSLLGDLGESLPVDKQTVDSPQVSNDATPESSFEDFLSSVQTEEPAIVESEATTAIPEESAVSANPRPRYRPSEPPRRKRRWPWFILFILAIMGTAGFLTRTHWMPLVQARFGHASLQKVSVVPAELNMELPPMDGEFLPPEDDSIEMPQDSSPEQVPVIAPTTATTTSTPQQETKAPSPEQMEHKETPKETPHPIATQKTVTPPPEKPVIIASFAEHAMDSAVISDIQGVFKDRKVRFHCNLALFSSTGGLDRKLTDFEDALRAVIANIFYFTVPGKTNLPEIERQVLLKAGFVFPDGKLIRVEVRNLELESVAP